MPVSVWSYTLNDDASSPPAADADGGVCRRRRRLLLLEPVDCITASISFDSHVSSTLRFVVCRVTVCWNVSL